MQMIYCRLAYLASHAVSSHMHNVYTILYIILHNIMLQNEEVCGNTIYSSSEASGVNHIIHRSRRLR